MIIDFEIDEFNPKGVSGFVKDKSSLRDLNSCNDFFHHHPFGIENSVSHFIIVERM